MALWELLSKVRGEVLKALETARNEKKINSGLEAKVLLNAELELKAKLKQYLPLLPGLFIVSQVDFLTAGTGDYRSEAIPGLEVTVQKADGDQVRPLLELLHSRRRKQALPNDMRALHRSSRRNRRGNRRSGDAELSRAAVVEFAVVVLVTGFLGYRFWRRLLALGGLVGVEVLRRSLSDRLRMTGKVALVIFLSDYGLCPITVPCSERDAGR